MRESDIEDIFRKDRLHVHRIRMLQDQDGKFKGAAFVEFSSKDDADKACGLNGMSLGDRKVRINPAASKPTR